jgi:hypothetical protein
MSEFPLKITTTRYDVAAAEVTVQYHGLEPLAQLDATIEGPFCRGLSLAIDTFAFDMADEETSSWRVAIHEPHFWSPSSPNLYRLKSSQWSERDWGIKSLTLRKRCFHLQEELHQLRGVRVTSTLTTELADLLKLANINMLVLPLQLNLEASAVLADQWGFHVIYEANPEDDASLWYAEEIPSQHISTFGYVLPQASMAHPQLWHNAMLHLHRQRRDIFIGITVDTVPLTMVQGHVEFLLASAVFIDALAAVKMPLIETVRRFDLLADALPDRMAGRICRVLPEEELRGFR